MTKHSSASTSAWEVVTKAAQQLSTSGVVSFEGPVDTGADLVYTPTKGPLKGTSVYISYKSSASTALPSVALANSLRLVRHLKNFPASRYVLATNGAVRDELIDVQVPHGMHVFGDVSTGEELASRVETLLGSSDE